MARAFVLLAAPSLAFAFQEVSVDAHGDMHAVSVAVGRGTQSLLPAPSNASRIAILPEPTGALLRTESDRDLPACPVSEYISVNNDCTCEKETCKKGQFCYSPDDGKETCQDDMKKDPYLIDVHGFTKNLGPDGRDSGALPTRKFTFVKKKDDSILRFMYSDNLRVYCPSSAACSGRWEIKIDGKGCPSGAMHQDLYVHQHQNPHRTTGIGGVCKGIGAGKHTVQVYVDKTRGYNGGTPDLYTGWASGSPSNSVHMEVQEIPEDYPFFSYTTGARNDEQDDGLISGRTLSFKKVSKDSNLRIFYTDNLRVHGPKRSCACRWEVRIDGKPCPSGPIMGDVYILQGENPHRPRSMVGWCSGVSAGNHKVDVHVTTTPGYLHYLNDGKAHATKKHKILFTSLPYKYCNCYSGWLNSRFAIEAEEIPKPYDMIHYNVHRLSDSRDSGQLAHYNVKFKKRYAETRLRLLLTESLRAYSVNKGTQTGDWEIFVDGKPCGSARIHAQIYSARNSVNQDMNPHRFRTFAGFCDEVGEGEHSVTVNLRCASGDCDLHTGWLNNPPGKASHGVLEAMEFFRPCSTIDAKADCKAPRCHWDEDECIDLPPCPGSDLVGVGADCACGTKKAASGKFCYEDKTIHDAKKEEKSAARRWTSHVSLLLLLAAMRVAP